MLWCVTTFFNPAGYKTPLQNYHVFKENLGANLLTVELSYDGKFYIADSVKLSANSVMWQKERLINYAISILPKCDCVAWLDSDIIFSKPWVIEAEKLLEKYDVIQPFEKVHYLKKDRTKQLTLPGIVKQSRESDWLGKRVERNLPFAAPGFAWAARREVAEVYDRDIVGSGDCIFADSVLDSWKLHGFEKKFTDKTKGDIKKWAGNKKLSVNYLPVDLFHLWHGNLKDRRYMQRHKTLIENNFDPQADIVLKNNVYEWATEKPRMHSEVKRYFYTRCEDV